ncbi:conserved hypothetical protein [Theileria orientalis strain Shintoku]|uniref:Uncharacterized protein n=1 Tax=Theileria orientalis strain Shintoku TaxID=869250 RepID=J4C7K5_THEOR|nr:conserved hypothetical protein [Theileria orientalis strain Shintoku]BAM39198.1 conserved hypothetical protein [Theileria orientalis strain Shintoku]|eukprot:XP_009689499.1 conserved hypothetical protein [Theileria orientalis strain Shintoku]
MGARQSYLYIYLNSKDKEYDESGCKVKPKKTVVNGSIDFEVVTYTIEYKGDSSYYDIYIYDSKETVYNGYYIFGYCSPRTHQVANKVEVYYSVLAPDKPLVISFVTNSQKYNCIYDDLKYARWNWASYITEHTFNDDLVTKLKKQYRKLNLNKTIEFDDGSKETKDVTSYKQKIDDESYRIIYTPKGRESVLNSNCLFSSDNKFADDNIPSEVKSGCKDIPSNEKKNKIDPYSLTSVKGRFFDGIIVYFAKDNGQPIDNKDNSDKHMALYLEFIDLRNKDICLKRKDKDGCWWAEESEDYTDNTSLGPKLKQLKAEVNKNDKSTIILDVKVSYTGVIVKNGESKQAYMKYTHEFTTDKDHNFMFGRKTITIGSATDSYGKSKNVEVYYLKASGKEDEQPFLIVLITNGQEKEKNKKAYYFNNTDKFDDWKIFNNEKPEELKKKLDEKLNKIENQLNCVKDLRLVRLMAHQILISEEPKPPDIKEATTPKRPDLETPGPTTQPPNWWLIIGCSVGGFLLLVALVVGYCIYWYNTTIKLLT